jgi:hypothetical protein
MSNALPLFPRIPPTSIAGAKRDLGIARSAGAAGTSFEDDAYRFLARYVASQPLTFLIEEVREQPGAPIAPNERAWGQVVRRAVAEGLIMKVGYAPARSSNLSPKCLWRACEQS